MERPALLMIDVQREYFTPDGPLWIPDGAAVLERLSGLWRAFRALWTGTVREASSTGRPGEYKAKGRVASPRPGPS